MTDYVHKPRSQYAQDNGWASTCDLSTGRLRMQAYSPGPRADWTQQWRETPGRDLYGRIPTVVRELDKATIEIARLVKEAERQAKIERKRREAECERWRREEEPLRVIDAWAAAKRLEEFFADAERQVRDLPDEQKERTIGRLRQTAALVGSTDALERFDAWRAPEER